MARRMPRGEFERWLDANLPDFLDALSQQPRTAEDWVSDLNLSVKRAAAALDRRNSGKSDDLLGDRDDDDEPGDEEDDDGEDEDGEDEDE